MEKAPRSARGAGGGERLATCNQVVYQRGKPFRREGAVRQRPSGEIGNRTVQKKSRRPPPVSFLHSALRIPASDAGMRSVIPPLPREARRPAQQARADPERQVRQ